MGNRQISQICNGQVQGDHSPPLLRQIEREGWVRWQAFSHGEVRYLRVVLCQISFRFLVDGILTNVEEEQAFIKFT